MKHANEQKLCGKLFQTPYISMSFIPHNTLSLMFPTETIIHFFPVSKKTHTYLYIYHVYIQKSPLFLCRIMMLLCLVFVFIVHILICFPYYVIPVYMLTDKFNIRCHDKYKPLVVLGLLAIVVKNIMFN